MDIIIQAITNWLKGILVAGIVNNLTGLFDNVNQKVGEIAGQVGTTPQAWNGGIYSMIKNLSDTVIMRKGSACLRNWKRPSRKPNMWMLS